MSILLYLNDGHAGGETVFYPSGDVTADRKAGTAVSVQPRAGAALCFWHGRHPLSPLHEGAPLCHNNGAPPKYVIRTEALFATEAAPTLSDQWSSSSYASAMLQASMSL